MTAFSDFLTKAEAENDILKGRIFEMTYALKTILSAKHRRDQIGKDEHGQELQALGFQLAEMAIEKHGEPADEYLAEVLTKFFNWLQANDECIRPAEEAAQLFITERNLKFKE